VAGSHRATLIEVAKVTYLRTLEYMGRRRSYSASAKNGRHGLCSQFSQAKGDEADFASDYTWKSMKRNKEKSSSRTASLRELTPLLLAIYSVIETPKLLL
jgi:hypothetical protein